MRDFRYAVRVLVKSPVFAVTAILTLALCIGANTAIYTVVDRVLLRALPYPHPERLAMIVRHYQGISEDDVSQNGHTWVALRQGAAASVDVAAIGLGGNVNLVANGQAMSVVQQRVSAGYFRVLAVAPAVGREFTDDEDRPAGPAVAARRRLWRELRDHRAAQRRRELGPGFRAHRLRDHDGCARAVQEQPLP